MTKIKQAMTSKLPPSAWSTWTKISIYKIKKKNK